MLLASVLTVQFTQYWTSTVRKHDAWPTKSLVACCMGCTIGNVVCTWGELNLYAGRVRKLNTSSVIDASMVVWSCDVFVLVRVAFFTIASGYSLAHL